MIRLRKKTYDFDLIILGTGGGGSVAAHAAREMGRKVAIFEAGDIGGECPNWACVPTKALLHAGSVYESAKNADLFG
jgi:dihydrolipoamide dehydrogenase